MNSNLCFCLQLYRIWDWKKLTLEKLPKIPKQSYSRTYWKSNYQIWILLWWYQSWFQCPFYLRPLLNHRHHFFLHFLFLFLKQRFFTMSKRDHHLLRKKVCQRISVMKINTGVFVVFKTEHELKCQFSGNIECICFHRWDSLTNFLS